MSARIGVITFPGTLDDVDAARAVSLAGGEAVSLWHADADLKGVDAVIVPGGFSYGDYLRCGAIARFAPVMGRSSRPPSGGMPILGICNGFQVLCEAGLLPGCADPQRGPALHLPRPVAEGRGHRYGVVVAIRAGCADPDSAQVGRGPLPGIGEACSTSSKAKAAWCSATRATTRTGRSAVSREFPRPTVAIVGLMPHPEHATEALTGPSDDGLGMFFSVINSFVGA